MRPAGQAVLEETDIRIAELKKEAYEFKRDIVVGAENVRTGTWPARSRRSRPRAGGGMLTTPRSRPPPPVAAGKTMAEKVVRFMEDKLRQKDAVVEKLRLKNGALKSQISKVESQLTQKVRIDASAARGARPAKVSARLTLPPPLSPLSPLPRSAQEEMGDVLHYIDFHQQEIENKQYVGTIEQRNRELLNLKKTTGRTVQVLNGLKKRLADLMSESEWLNSEIKGRTELLGKVRPLRPQSRPRPTLSPAPRPRADHRGTRARAAGRGAAEFGQYGPAAAARGHGGHAGGAGLHYPEGHAVRVTERGQELGAQGRDRYHRHEADPDAGPPRRRPVRVAVPRSRVAWKHK